MTSVIEQKRRSLADNLKSGEEYAGLVLGKNGAPDHHLILLPGQIDGVEWEKAKAWATKQGGELPTRREQSLLFANLPEVFDKRAYWSSEAESKDYAWCQYFFSGTQYNDLKFCMLRGRAVRRVYIQGAENVD